MKKAKEQLERALQAFIDKMGKEEFNASLEMAGLELYKNIKLRVFSARPKLAMHKSLLCLPMCRVVSRVSAPVDYPMINSKHKRTSKMDLSGSGWTNYEFAFAA